jgi:hypothetical protein
MRVCPTAAYTNMTAISGSTATYSYKRLATTFAERDLLQILACARHAHLSAPDLRLPRAVPIVNH